MLGQCCVLNHDTLFLSILQSKTPALVFEYINNTDFKVSLPGCGGGRPPISFEVAQFLGSQILLKSCEGSLGLFPVSASPSFLHVNEKLVKFLNRLHMRNSRGLCVLNLLL